MLESAEIGHRLSKAIYAREEPQLRDALLNAQYDLSRSGRGPLLIIFSGVEGGGRGETANKLTEWMDPRHIHVAAFGPRAPEEAVRPLEWRYWRALAAQRTARHLPQCMVWRSDGGASRRRDRRRGLRAHLEAIREHEQMLTDEGVVLLKFWIHLSKAEQKRRLQSWTTIRARPGALRATDWHAYRSLQQGATDCGSSCWRKRRPANAPWKVVEGTDERYRNLTVGKFAARRPEGDARCAAGTLAQERVASDSRRQRRWRPTMSSLIRGLDLSKTLSHRKYRERTGKVRRQIRHAVAPQALRPPFADPGLRRHRCRRQGWRYSPRHRRPRCAAVRHRSGRRPDRGGTRLSLSVAVLAQRPAARAASRSSTGRGMAACWSNASRGYAAVADWMRAYHEINQFRRTADARRRHRRQVLAADQQGRATAAIQGTRDDFIQALQDHAGRLAQPQEMGCLRARGMRHGRSHQHRHRAMDAGRGRGQVFCSHQDPARPLFDRLEQDAIARLNAHRSYLRPALAAGRARADDLSSRCGLRLPCSYRRQRVDTPDGDFVDFDWLDDDEADGDAPLVVLFHGLEGSSSSHYARALMAHLRGDRMARRRAAFSRLQRRAQSAAARLSLGRPRRSRAGCWRRSARSAPDARDLSPSGVSLGGSALLNWLGREEARAATLVAAAAAVSTPLDLTAAGIAIGQGLNRIYALAFPAHAGAQGAWRWRADFPATARRTPHIAASTRCTSSTTPSPRRCTASPAPATTGRAQAASRGSESLTVPTLVLNARNDPFVPAASLPRHGGSQRARSRWSIRGKAATRVSRSRRFPAIFGWLPPRLVAFLARATMAGRSDRPTRRKMTTTLPEEIFKAYDIRGIVGKTLTAPIVRRVGQAFGTLALERGRDTARGRPRRPARPGPSCAARSPPAFRRSGANVIDIGMVTTPMSYFAAHHLAHAMQRDGHRQPQSARLQRPEDGHRRRYAGGAEIQALQARIDSGRLEARRRQLPRPPISRPPISTASPPTSSSRGRMKIAVDCGNGVAGAFAPALFRRWAATVTELFCEVDGTFPNHHPDPSQPKNLQRPDRLPARGPTTNSGSPSTATATAWASSPRTARIIYPDRQLMLFAADVLVRNPGRDSDLRRQVDAQPQTVDHAPRRQAAAVEDGTFADQGAR